MKKIIISILAAALVLFGVSAILQDTAEQKAQEARQWYLESLLLGGKNFVEEPYDGEDANIQAVYKSEIGYVIETSAYGYAGEIRMFVGVRNDGRVSGLVVTEAHETLGLGSHALTDPDFLSQFLNSTGSFEIVTGGTDAFSGATGAATEGGETVEVDAITGATVTSKAVARCVNSAVGFVTGADAASSATTWGG